MAYLMTNTLASAKMKCKIIPLCGDFFFVTDIQPGAKKKRTSERPYYCKSLKSVISYSKIRFLH